MSLLRELKSDPKAMARIIAKREQMESAEPKEEKSSDEPTLLPNTPTRKLEKLPGTNVRF